MEREHISHLFDEDLISIKTSLMTMAGLIEEALNDSIQGMKENDLSILETVRNNCKQYSEIEVNVDQMCNEFIALRHPAAKDLRTVIAISKTAGELENMTHHIANITNYYANIIEYEKAPEDAFLDIRHLAEQVTRILHLALDSFARFDLSSALKLLKEINELEAEHKNATRILLTSAIENSNVHLRKTLNLFWILYALDRIGEYSKAIATYVIFVVNGNDVRHMSYSRIMRLMEKRKDT